VGLDSDLGSLPQCVRRDANPIYTFNKAIIEATAPYVCAYKPNLAFYLSAGVKGLEALKLTIDAIPPDIPVILDCKVGDIGNTMEAYIKAFFEEMGADAITVNPLMGKDVLRVLLSEEKYFGFVLALTSNPSAKDFLLKDELYSDIADWIRKYNPKQVGAVVGATQPEYLAALRKLMPEQIFLIPGVGAQGGDLKAVLTQTVKSANEPNIIINSSRGIIFKDNKTSFAETAGKEAEKLRNEIRKGLKK
jgi:orotidine-5'-phosphate decarboxylase